MTKRPWSFAPSSFWRSDPYGRYVSWFRYEKLREMSPRFLHTWFGSHDGHYLYYKGAVSRDRVPFLLAYDIGEDMRGGRFCSSLPFLIGEELQPQPCREITHRDVGARLFVLGFHGDLQALQDRTAAAEMIGQVRKSVWAMTAAADIEQVLETVGEGLRRMRVPYDFASVSILSEESDGEVYTINQLGEWRARNEPVETTTISEIVKGGVVRYRPDIRADDPFGEALL